MTEYHSFNTSDMKNMCRACLQVKQEVFAMSPLEINTYQRFTDKIANMDYDMNICLLCKWILRKCMKFTQQCWQANNILNQSVTMDYKSNLFLHLYPAYDLKTTPLDVQYLGPTDDLDLNEEKHEYVMMGDHFSDVDDDDEIPLVMLQDDKYKNRSNKINEVIMEPEIKQEPEIKEEYPLESYKGRKKKKKKELKEGFSSRMVQETDEYIVIKLTRDQVLSELADKAKTESYVRSPFKCEKCVKGFNFEDVLQAHMKKHTLEHGSYECDICNQYCPNPVSLRGHIKSHTTRYKCKLCGQIRLSRQHLLEHHAITHTAAPTTYTCDKCQFTTNKRTVIQRHVKTHSATERHACHRCGKLFNTIESLRVHTMRHDKSKCLQCPHCDKQFIYPSLLRKHTEAVHERQDYYCVECDVNFKSPESLRLHFKKAKRHRDSSSYRYECPHCPQRFVTTATLSVHLTSTHGEPKQHSCGLCRRHYSSREALRAHTWRVHTHRDERASCHVCHKTFVRKSILKVHLRSHTGERPHACECGAAFAQRASLKLHRAAKHQKQEDLPNGIEVPPTMPQET